MTKENQKSRTRITYEERVLIEDMLSRSISVRSISKQLNRSVSTISREIKNRKILIKSKRNACLYNVECTEMQVCGSTSCHGICKKCIHCYKHCNKYKEVICPKLLSSPYVCNGCSRKGMCNYKKYLYKAADAEKRYRELLVNRRNGFNMELGTLIEINDMVSPLIKKGQSPYHIKQILGARLPISEATLRRMISSCELDARNVDLRNQVKRKTRVNRNASVNRLCVSKIGHTYKDYLSYIAEHDLNIVQMDCMEGNKEDNAVLLTLHFPHFKFQLAFIMNAHDSENVISTLDMIEETLGSSLFKDIFPLILTDNGHEFADINSIERSVNSGKRTHVYFCEPNRSDQKGNCENNHKYIRYIIPKGTSMERFSQRDISIMMNHINSLSRKSLYGKTPYEVAYSFLPEDFFIFLGLEKINSAEVILNPSLLKKHFSE